MKIIKGQYITPDGHSITIELHRQLATPIIQVVVGMTKSVRIPVHMWNAARVGPRFQMLLPVLPEKWVENTRHATTYNHATAELMGTVDNYAQP